MTKIRSFIFILAAVMMSAALPACAWGEDLNISTLADLENFRERVKKGENFQNCIITLSADITLSGEWTPIGTDEHPFSGKFNGGNHTISGLNVTTETMRDLTVAGVKGKGGALFLNVEGENAQIANLTVEGSIDGAPSGNVLAAGGIAARLGPGAVIYRCLNKATVTLGSTGTELGPYAYAGGVAGYSEGHVIYCVNEGTVTARAKAVFVMAGGIAGSQHGGGILFSDNDALVAVQEEGNDRRAYAGGIAGSAESASISCVRNQQPVSSYTLAGGITAFAMDSVLRDAVNVAAVTCTGQKDADATAGGITAQLYNGSAAVNCYNTGSVTADGSPWYSYAGGIAGWSGAGFYSSNKIYNCTNTGAVSGTASSSARAGGLVGELNKTELYSSVNTGTVSAGGFAAGGVAGYKYSTADVHDVAYSGELPPMGMGDRNSSNVQTLTKAQIDNLVVTSFPSLSPVIVKVAQDSSDTVKILLHSHPGGSVNNVDYYSISDVYVTPDGYASATTDGSSINVTGTEPGVALLAAYVKTYRSGAGGAVDRSSPSTSLVSALVWVPQADGGDVQGPDVPGDGSDNDDINIPAGPGTGDDAPLWPDDSVPSVPGEPDTDKGWNERYPGHSCGGGGCNAGWGALALLALVPLAAVRKNRQADRRKNME